MIDGDEALTQPIIGPQRVAESHFVGERQGLILFGSGKGRHQLLRFIDVAQQRQPDAVKASGLLRW